MIWHDGLPDLARANAFGADSMAGHLGIEFTAVGDDWIAARMPVNAGTMQPYGRLHGGASVALAETLGSVAGAMTVDPAHFAAVGLEINANHVRPAGAGWVTATARPEARGRSTQVWSIRIEDEAGKLVCISRFTVAIIPRDRGAPAT
ncbi:thioesterase [Sphingomonas sp. Leaf412]|uniref:hotdog fold thioesterase n=1 Tax=Sphingomonas sp. Leaf412 TaxID=1736370 RepID=UPI0006F57F36|nr:hotdog fold thioesterase [Sphingomonas sp. Leaf412]KQT32060.1 thioesterase [Sphingomonas sp. Leaf412]